MTREDFTELIKTLKEKDNQSVEIYQKYNIDLINYEEDFHKIIGLLMSYLFTEKGWDWISYYLYEDNCEVWDKDSNEIPFKTVDDLYDYLEREGYLTYPVV